MTMSVSVPLQSLRRLGSTLLRGQSSRYTAGEVRALLSPQTKGALDRQEAVLTTASVPSSWTDYLRQDDARLLGRVTTRLPMIVFLYRAGHSLEEIGRRICLFGGPWIAERALEVATHCIAARLNERGMPNVRGAL